MLVSSCTRSSNLNCSSSPDSASSPICLSSFTSKMMYTMNISRPMPIRVAAKVTAVPALLPAMSGDRAVPSVEPSRPKPTFRAMASASSYPLNHFTRVRSTTTQETSSPMPKNTRPIIMIIRRVPGSSDNTPSAPRALSRPPRAAAPPNTIPVRRMPQRSRMIPPTMIMPNTLAMVVMLISVPNWDDVMPSWLSISGFRPE